jgi:hypothetical protein
VVNDFGSLRRAFVETDIAEADRETVVRDFLSGQYSNALRVVAFNTAEGWSRDMSEDIAGELLDRAFDAHDNLSEDTKRFIDRHVTPGEKARRRCAAALTMQVGERPAREAKKAPVLPGLLRCEPVVGARCRDRGGASSPTQTRSASSRSQFWTRSRPRCRTRCAMR